MHGFCVDIRSNFSKGSIEDTFLTIRGDSDDLSSFLNCCTIHLIDSKDLCDLFPVSYDQFTSTKFSKYNSSLYEEELKSFSDLKLIAKINFLISNYDIDLLVGGGLINMPSIPGFWLSVFEKNEKPASKEILIYLNDIDNSFLLLERLQCLFALHSKNNLHSNQNSDFKHASWLSGEGIIPPNGWKLR